MTSRLLSKLEDFRLLPFFVLSFYPESSLARANSPGLASLRRYAGRLVRKARSFSPAIRGSV